MGWALGAILYEINEYPWAEKKGTRAVVYSWFYVILASLIGEYQSVCCIFGSVGYC